MMDGGYSDLKPMPSVKIRYSYKSSYVMNPEAIIYLQDLIKSIADGTYDRVSTYECKRLFVCKDSYTASYDGPMSEQTACCVNCPLYNASGRGVYNRSKLSLDRISEKLLELKLDSLSS